MAEPVVTAPVAIATVVHHCMVGGSACLFLAVVGIDIATIICSFIGYVIIQTLLPAQEFKFKRAAATALGTMLFASILTPWVTPHLAKIAPEPMTPEHVRVSAAVLISMFPKPLLMWLQLQWQKRFPDQEKKDVV